MKVFVTGVGGQLGHDVVNELISRGHEAIGSDIAKEYAGVSDGSPVTTASYVQLDITDKNAVDKVITALHPDAIIHCAAWTAVDAAEDEENREKVDKINHLGTQYIAEAAKSVSSVWTGFISDTFSSYLLSPALSWPSSFSVSLLPSPGSVPAIPGPLSVMASVSSVSLTIPSTIRLEQESISIGRYTEIRTDAQRIRR